MDSKKIEEKLADLIGWKLNKDHSLYFPEWELPNSTTVPYSTWHPLTSHDQMWQCVEAMKQDKDIDYMHLVILPSGKYIFTIYFYIKRWLRGINQDMLLAIAEAIGRCQGWWEE